MISGILAHVHVTESSIDTWVYAVVISTDIFSNWQNSYAGSLICGVKVIMIERAM